MSKKDDIETTEDNSKIISVSPYENMSLQYESQNEFNVSDSQLRLSCLEASITFYELHCEFSVI